jgi:hypothetical protein
VSESLIASLNQRITELTTEKANLQAALKESRSKGKASVEELETLRQQVQALSAERDTIKAKVDLAPTELAAENAKLKAAIRQRDHKDAFKARALEKGVSPARVEALYKLSDLTPPDEGEITAEAFDPFLDEAQASHDWAFSTPASHQAAPNGATQGTATAGLGRSASGTSATQVRYSMADVQKPGWQQSNPTLAKALEEGRAVLAG